MIRTIKIDKTLYVSVIDTAEFLVDKKVLTKKKAEAWRWNLQKNILSDLKKTYNPGEYIDIYEPIIVSFFDWFIYNHKLISHLPDNENDDVRKFIKQFDFTISCQDEVFFKERCFVFKDKIIENAQFIENRIGKYEHQPERTLPN
jgi:hypothetical protein